MDPAPASLPPILAGPLLRRAAPERLVLWLVGSRPYSLRLRLYAGGETAPLLDRVLAQGELLTLPLGARAFLFLVDVVPDAPLPVDRLIGYDIGVSGEGTDGEQWIADWAPHLCRPGAPRPDFALKPRLDRLLHGSCRRPHDPAADGLGRVDAELLGRGDDPAARPALLMMSGDQIYADDVAGPTLRAIHSLIGRLGLFDESLSGAEVGDGAALLAHPSGYYHRDRLLPATALNRPLLERFFGGASKPVFTTRNARNHLVTLAEVLAMYLLVWSPVCWPLADISPPPLGEAEAARWRAELAQVERFVEGLPRAARALAHLPTHMIFDDHDISDDWNLSAEWESLVYAHPFSRRIVGNALLAYLLCQGWGNRPEAFGDLMPALGALLAGAAGTGKLDTTAQDALIDRLLRFQQWHYSLPTHPKLVVLDTRTRRWRSENSQASPSGLMDWEALSEFQQELLGETAVVVVSPAPIFGVKLIEAIQRVFTWLGRPLMVDAENWMAHPGTANVMLNIFGHSATPDNFVILSGDVHYSFVYDVRLRQGRARPRIWQITSSGIKSEFPPGLLEWLDRLNRWLYSPRSPLNWFTKRRRMHIDPRPPTGRSAGERLWNHAGVGLVILDETGVPTDIRQLDAQGGGTRFPPDPDSNAGL